MEKSRGEMPPALFGWRGGLVPTTQGGRQLARDASCHPFQKGSLLWRSDDKRVVACAFASVPLNSSKKIAEPMPFVGIRLGKEVYEGEAKMVSQGGS